MAECQDGYNYTGERYTSFVAEWDLVCERDTLGKLSQTLVMVGMFLGAFFLPALADCFGRKRLHVGANFLSLIVVVAMAFVPNFIGFSVLRVFIGVFNQGYVIPMFIMMIELFPPQQRELIGFSSSFLWGISVVLITPIAYFIMLDESLLWVVKNKRTKDAIKIVKKACKMNHKDFDSVRQTIKDKSDAMNVYNETEQLERATLLNEPEVTYEMDRPRLFQVCKHGQEDERTSPGATMKVSF
ncbi:solute carrier family 22 member 6-like [Gigantopelta aegis]|uniref:solute carrier family 22 member 6-like n=1 Tax=Gigantopelta aegis TaxID=1735272 RepID=UPI001B88AE33|nr:solute carrier family 22 member 6-like [Gigantopelta aegis]